MELFIELFDGYSKILQLCDLNDVTDLLDDSYKMLFLTILLGVLMIRLSKLLVFDKLLVSTSFIAVSSSFFSLFSVFSK
jgi:hypothetical protein